MIPPAPVQQAKAINLTCAAQSLQVGDFHRTLLYGGIYGYPGDKKNKNGKLRLLYECAPMSMIAEQVGTRSSVGSSVSKLRQSRSPLSSFAERNLPHIARGPQTLWFAHLVRPVPAS